MGLPAARFGDVDVFHCSLPIRIGGSFNVLINGRFAQRQGDLNAPHLLPAKCPVCCVIHAAPVAVGSLTVRINGRGAARMTDTIAGCTSVATGSFNVRIGA